MNISLAGAEQEILQALAIAIATVIVWAIKNLAQKFSVDKNSAIVAALDDAAEKGVNYAVVEASDAIKAKGWDSVDVKNQVVASAVQQMLAHSQKAIANAGYDPSTEAGQAAIAQVVTRVLPRAMNTAAASPATPQA